MPPEQPKSPGSSWERKSSPEAQGPTRWPWVVAVLVVAGAAGYFYWSRKQAQARQVQSAAVGIRTFRVEGGGRIEHTLLLTGQTGPEKYSSLLTPQLRGARGQAGRGDGSNFNTRERGGRNSGGGGGGNSGGSSSASTAST